MTAEELKNLIDDAATNPNNAEAVMTLADAKKGIDDLQAEHDSVVAEKDGIISERDSIIERQAKRITELEEYNRRIVDKYVRAEFTESNDESEGKDYELANFNDLIKRFD